MAIYFKIVKLHQKAKIGALLLILISVMSTMSLAEISNLSTADVRSAMANDPDIVLINVLPKIIFDYKHIDGSLNIPIGRLSSLEAFVGSKDTRLIFYCMGRL